MINNTRDLLLSAWRENRLAAVHIDLQNLYVEGNEAVFHSVGNFADRLRGHGIPNTWVAFPRIAEDNSCHVSEGITTVQDFNRMALHPDLGFESLISPLVQAHSFEDTIVKHWGSGFEKGTDSALYQHLDAKGADTVLIAGVAAYACIARTLHDGANLDRFDFIVVEDCINIPAGTRYKDAILNNALSYGDVNMDALQRRFHSACSASVLEALEQNTPRDTAILHYRRCHTAHNLPGLYGPFRTN